jgi:hypothetical protein
MKQPAQDAWNGPYPHRGCAPVCFSGELQSPTSLPVGELRTTAMRAGAGARCIAIVPLPTRRPCENRASCRRESSTRPLRKFARTASNCDGRHAGTKIRSGSPMCEHRAMPSLPGFPGARPSPAAARDSYLLRSSWAQDLPNSSRVHLKSRRHPALHSPFVGLMTKPSPPLETGTVGPGRGDV